MSVENVFPNKDQFDTMNMFLAAIASNQGGISVTKWADVQRLVRQGLHTKEFVVADQLDATWGDQTITFDVLDFDKHTPKDANLTHSLCMCSHGVLRPEWIYYSGPQLMYYTENGLPVGNYKFTLEGATHSGGPEYNGTYMFTTTKPIPADGGFRHTNIGAWRISYAKSDVPGDYITTYGARPQRTVVEADLTVTEWDGTTECTDLGTFNAFETSRDVSNSGMRNGTETQSSINPAWHASAIRQWLNSDAPAVDAADNTTVSNWWTPQTVFDNPPEQDAWAKSAGFLYNLDPELVAVIGEIEVKTNLPTQYRTTGENYIITHDKVWLQSASELVGPSYWLSPNEGVQLDYWVGTSESDRIKYYNSSPMRWALRTCDVTHSNVAIMVNEVGVIRQSYVTLGAVPTFCII